MAQYIKQGNIFGRIGGGIGQGFAEQAPKAVERGRLAAGLQQLGQKKNLSPFQKFAGLIGVTGGEHPQITQSAERLLSREAQANALSRLHEQQQEPKPQEPPSKFPGLPSIENKPEEKEFPSLTKGENLEQVQEGYIPPSAEERDRRAAEVFNENPDRFDRDPEKAVAWVDNEIAQEEKRDIARTAQHARLTGIQDNVVNRLKHQATLLSAQVPADLYSQIEDEAIQATKPRKDGGDGMTEQQAMKKYGEKLNNASRTFAKLGELGAKGGWAITTRPAAETLRSIKGIQEEMEKLDQTDNMAKTLIADQQISPKFAYAISEPVSRVPELNSYVKKLPALEKEHTMFESLVPPYVSVPATLNIAPRLAKFIKDNPKASPLAIAYEIEKKGYDIDTFLQYLTDHDREINMKQRQKEQVDTPRNLVTPWNDWWLSSFSGIE